MSTPTDYAKDRSRLKLPCVCCRRLTVMRFYKHLRVTDQRGSYETRAAPLCARCHKQVAKALKGGTMPETDHFEKLIVTLGQRISQQNDIFLTIAERLQEIELHLRQLAISSNPAPNYQRPLSEYANFDWSSIGAAVLSRDKDGATAVEWNGQVFKRRSPNNKYDAAVFFSRCLGKDAAGNNQYARLIKFTPPAEAEPISNKAKKAIRS
jgi:hypothetical protein